MARSEWFNDDQVGHMESLAKIPPDKRCASGWHELRETCDCAQFYGGAKTLAERLERATPTTESEDA